MSSKRLSQPPDGPQTLRRKPHAPRSTLPASAGAFLAGPRSLASFDDEIAFLTASIACLLDLSIANAIKTLDTDGDGLISLEEFKAIAWKCASPWRVACRHPAHAPAQNDAMTT